jgi:hypothetical protein
VISNKILHFRYLVIVIIIGNIFISCTTLRHRSLAFEKRKYTKGYFFNGVRASPSTKISKSTDKSLRNNLNHNPFQIPKNNIAINSNALTKVSSNFIKISSTHKAIATLCNKVTIHNLYFSSLNLRDSISKSGLKHQTHHREKSPGLRGFINTIISLILFSIALVLGLTINNLVFLIGPLAIAAFILLIIGFIKNIRGLKKEDPNHDLASIGLLIDILILLSLISVPLLFGV